MRPLWSSLALLLVSLLHVEGYTCPSGKSKETITLAVGESVDFSTQETDTYGKNVKCVVKFKRGKKSKCKLNFSCSAFTLTAKNSNCNKGSDFMKIGKEKFCEDNSPDVTVNGRTLNVLFRSNKRSKGGDGAECTATCISNEEASTSVPPTEPPTTTPTPATTAAPTTGAARYNFLAGLSYSWDSSNSPFCAAALVSSRWVLTSASCSYGDSSVVSPDTVNVMMGSTAVSVDKVIVHSGYSQSGGENNIALWRLAQASKEFPLCLPAQGSQQTGTARLVGWRINPLQGYLNEELGEKEVALVEDCGQSGRICSTFATTECGGDFGGPLLQGGADTLIGTAVSDSGCGGAAGGKGLFTQISEHTDWVKSTISGNGGGNVCTNR